MLIAVVLVSCKSQQNLINGNEQLMFVPCSSITSDHFATRALGTSSSANMQMAKDKAIAAARKELASSIQTTVQRALDTYASSYDDAVSSEFMSATQDIARLTTNLLLTGTTIACEKITQSRDKKSGNTLYHAYVVVEVDNAQLRQSTQKQVTQSLGSNEDLLRQFQSSQLDEAFNQTLPAKK